MNKWNEINKTNKQTEKQAIAYDMNDLRFRALFTLVTTITGKQRTTKRQIIRFAY